jgi:hypothetical protein
MMPSVAVVFFRFYALSVAYALRCVSLAFAACGQLSEAFVARSKRRMRISIPPRLAETALVARVFVGPNVRKVIPALTGLQRSPTSRSKARLLFALRLCGNPTSRNACVEAMLAI